MRIYTVGFTKKSASHFFEELLEPSGATRLLDVRIRNASQLSGFAIRSPSRQERRTRPRLLPAPHLRDGLRPPARTRPHR